jgi:hypothetical protein
MIKLIDDENKELHILGDLNCNLLNINSNQPTKTLKAILAHCFGTRYRFYVGPLEKVIFGSLGQACPCPTY